VCKRCGYGCYGKPTSRASAKGKIPYAYYRCTGSDAYRFDGQRLCWNKQIRTDMLDAAVWDDVRRLLSEPERIRKEYERRLQGPETGLNREAQHLSKMVRNVKKMISRLIDAYGEGLLDKSEFEPRISAARERLAKLEAEYRQRIGEAAKEAELRLVIGQLEEFASRLSQGLEEPDWETRREVVRALVKKVEIDEQEVRIVYRVSPSPFEGGPQQGHSQHCWGRVGRPLRLMTSDDYPAYKEAILQVYGTEVSTTPTGRPSRRMELEKVPPPGLTYATVEKRRRWGRVVGILVHLIFGTVAALAKALRRSQVSGQVNVSFLERHNATDRHKNARKVRKAYTFSKDWRVHESMTYFTMYSYNLCWSVRTLVYRDGDGRVRSRSPAMAAGLADHVWTMREWITMPSVQCA
jgi:site-specific DNA recombinase